MGKTLSRIVSKSNLNARQAVDEIRSHFQSHASTEDGLLTLEQCIGALAELHIQLNEEQLLAAIEEANEGSSLPTMTHVDFPLFMRILKRDIDNRGQEEMLREAFDAFDVHGDGVVKVGEIVSVMRAMGNGRRTEEEIAGMMAVCGVRNTGEGIGFEQMKRLMLADRDVTERVRRLRRSSPASGSTSASASTSTICSEAESVASSRPESGYRQVPSCECRNTPAGASGRAVADEAARRLSNEMVELNVAAGGVGSKSNAAEASKRDSMVSTNTDTTDI